jgi:outer membrane protein assembly factor BamB
MKMQNVKNKTMAIIVALILMTSMGISTFAMQFANAKNVNGTIPTYAYLIANPEECAVGQTIYLAMWIDKVPPSAAGIAGGDLWGGFTITVTAPDGTNKTLGPFISDNAGGAPATFVPTALGNYTFTFNFPGMTLTGNANSGNPSDAYLQAHPSIYAGNVYGASTSQPAVVVVGQTPASTIPENPLPTGYWENPIQGFNHLWYAIGGDWLGMEAATFANTGNYAYDGNFNPYSQPVLAPHILWTRPEAFGGQVGGVYNTSIGTGDEASIYYTGAEYQPKFSPVIMAGVLYYEDYPTSTASPNGWYAVNLRSGDTIWYMNTTDHLICGQNYNYKSINQYGVYPYLWGSRGSFLDMFDAKTGKYILTINSVVSGTKILGDEGSILEYYVNTTTVGSGDTAIRTSSLTLWNSSKAIAPNIVSQWSPTQGGNFSYQQGIEWTIPLPQSYNGWNFTNPGVGPVSFGIRAIDRDDHIIVFSLTIGNLSSSPWELQAGYTMGGTTNGEGPAKQLWIVNNTVTAFTSRSAGPAGGGVYTEYEKETLQWYGYNIHTGAQMWNNYYNGNPLGYYDQKSAVIAYGCLYTWTFGGWVYCYNLTTGATIWSWSDGSAGTNTPYGVNPLWIIGNAEATVAGGMFYVETGHNYGPPLFSGAMIYALNATDGKLVWQFLNTASTSSLPVVYGDMLSFDCYDLQIYCYGKGLTATTVDTQPGINANSKVLITGTVTDQSPGQTCLGIPAAGTPAIADASMSDWMAYLYKQSPEPMNATGVPVTLSYIDPNNNTYTIGSTTSDINGHYSYAFTPDVSGSYTVIATFGGSNSYFASSGETSMLYAQPASATSTPGPTPPQSAADMYFVPAVAGIIVAIVIVGAILVLLLLRKRP